MQHRRHQPPRRLGQQGLQRVEQAVGDDVLERVGEGVDGRRAVGEPLIASAIAGPMFALSGNAGRGRSGQVDRDDTGMRHDEQIAERGRRPRPTPGPRWPSAGAARGPRSSASRRAPTDAIRWSALGCSLAAVVVRSSMIAISTIAEAGDGGATDVEVLQRRHDRLAEAGAVDEGRDGRHRQRGHRALVDADDDRAAGHRQLRPCAAAARVVTPSESAASSGGRGHRPDAVLGDPHQRRQRVDQRADDGRAAPRCRRAARAAAGRRTTASSASRRGPA